MRVVFLIGCLIFSHTFCHARSHHFGFESGYNRVGLFFNPYYELGLGNHGISVGARTYAYNLFFETVPVGLNMAYRYRIDSKSGKLFFYPSVNFSIFREKKTNATFLLSEVSLKHNIGFFLTKKLAITQGVGVGIIPTWSKQNNADDSFEKTYYNGEITVGLVYHFNDSRVQ